MAINDLVRVDEFQGMLDGLRGEGRSVNVLSSTFSDVPGGHVVDGLLTEVRTLLETGDLERDTGVALARRINGMLNDMEALPMKPGHARPSDEDLARVDGLIGNSNVFSYLATELYHSIWQNASSRSFSDYYNDFRTYSKERADLIWTRFTEDIGVAPELKRIAQMLATSISVKEGEDPMVLAMEDLKAAFVNSPTRYLTSKNPAFILVNKLKRAMSESFEQRLVLEVRSELPLVEGADPLENSVELERCLGLAQDFLVLDEMASLDMLANPLGQAQTADPDKGEAYFRSREGVSETGTQNNFGYVYLSGEQFDSMPGLKGKGAEFEYFGKPYYAVPVGAYFLNKDSDRFTALMFGLEALVEEHNGTPVSDYYDLLRKYYDLPLTAQNVADPAFVQEYHDVCYEAERAWVAYVKYAGQHKLPFVHIHPFEKYGTTSTKSHDLALGIVNHQETEMYLKAKDKFVANAKAFLKRSGIEERYPEMVAESLRLIESAAILSLGARMGSQLRGTIAQNIPNEEPGRRDGIVTLCDTAFAKKRLKSGHGMPMKESDPVGGLGETYDGFVDDPETFMLHYVLEILSHELNHNMYKGEKQVFGGDARGLAIQLVEEAKATNGLALAFEDPDNLSDEDISRLQKALPLMMPWSILRFRKELRDEHTSHQYLREGAVMLDHALKSGLLEVAQVDLDENGEPIVCMDDCEYEGQFQFLRYNLGEKQIRDYIARCARFEERLAPIYYEVEGHGGKMDSKKVVPDITDIDIWQALSRECYLEERGKLVAQNGESHPDVMAIDFALEKLVPPTDTSIAPKVKALIANANFVQPARMRTAVAKAFGLPQDSPELDAKVADLQAKLKVSHPQIH